MKVQAMIFRNRLKASMTVIGFIVAVAAGTGAILATASGAAPLAGDATRGAEVYENNCTGCHSLDASRVGPAHRGVFGRKAGSVKDFTYSPALKKAKFVWDAARLDTWLANPQAFVPGAKMGFRLSDPQRRADVIAYLKQESGK
jgi:cytochrome c